MSVGIGRHYNSILELTVSFLEIYLQCSFDGSFSYPWYNSGKLYGIKE
jgi:hypothetical protein